ncbi:uncharacterized protein LOC133790262 [Humulus lupulus]|uniref:uncharacterized protein LOC133790262 n=1 Tax=Humulus lupulus TaxID=3486 RepID=UPI002B4165E9|nr:uncharacterized protein LOC133790262 [Humulus lupulus]
MSEDSKRPLDIVESPPQRPSKLAKISDDDDNEEEGGEEFGLDPQSMTQNPRNNIQRYLIAIEYIGTRFSGSQQQPKFRTVVGVLQEAFRKFVGKPVSIFCSSRTDAGVHALSNVCHVDVERISKRRPGEVLPPHEPDVVKKAVNHFLQKNEGDIMVIDVRSVPPDYHARHKAQERMYFYRLLSGPEPLSTLEKGRAWHVPEELNLCAMQEACKVLVGHHDFSTFRGSGCQAKSPVRTLDELNVSEMAPTPYFPSIAMRSQNGFTHEDTQSFHSESNLGFGMRRKHRCLVVTARARSFLYHQVRLLVGVLKAVGTGDLTIADVERILNARTVNAASPMAPACGLYLGQVKYDLP